MARNEIVPAKRAINEARICDCGCKKLLRHWRRSKLSCKAQSQSVRSTFPSREQHHRRVLHANFRSSYANSHSVSIDMRFIVIIEWREQRHRPTFTRLHAGEKTTSRAWGCLLKRDCCEKQEITAHTAVALAFIYGLKRSESAELIADRPLQNVYTPQL
jgi:hypothetical protein